MENLLKKLRGRGSFLWLPLLIMVLLAPANALATVNPSLADDYSGDPDDANDLTDCDSDGAGGGGGYTPTIVDTDAISYSYWVLPVQIDGNRILVLFGLGGGNPTVQFVSVKDGRHHLEDFDAP